MNKGELIDLVATELKTSKAEAGRALDTVLDCITKGVKKEEKVAIAGFGTFTKKKQAGRMGINPATKEPIKIAPSKTCGFKASTALQQVL